MNESDVAFGMDFLSRTDQNSVHHFCTFQNDRPTRQPGTSTCNQILAVAGKNHRDTSSLRQNADLLSTGKIPKPDLTLHSHRNEAIVRTDRQRPTLAAPTWRSQMAIFRMVSQLEHS